MEPKVELRKILDGDLPLFFRQQLDEEANFRAAFTSEDPSDMKAFNAHWSGIMADATVVGRTILCDGLVAGHVSKYEEGGHAEITYWTGREFWGKGIATRAVLLFLGEMRERPLFGRVAQGNPASERVLAKCGFKLVGRGSGYANARRAEVEESIYCLD